MAKGRYKVRITKTDVKNAVKSLLSQGYSSVYSMQRTTDILKSDMYLIYDSSHKDRDDYFLTFYNKDVNKTFQLTFQPNTVQWAQYRFPYENISQVLEKIFIQLPYFSKT